MAAVTTGAVSGADGGAVAAGRTAGTLGALLAITAWGASGVLAKSVGMGGLAVVVDHDGADSGGRHAHGQGGAR